MEQLRATDVVSVEELEAAACGGESNDERERVLCQRGCRWSFPSRRNSTQLSLVGVVSEEGVAGRFRGGTRRVSPGITDAACGG